MKKLLKYFLAFSPLSAFAANTAPNLLQQSTSTTPSANSGMPSLIMLVVFIIVFYFLLLRPQFKRNKEQKQLLSTLEKGDEVLTSSGICGIISKIDNNFVELEIAKEVVIKIQKQAIISLLPKASP